VGVSESTPRKIPALSLQNAERRGHPSDFGKPHLKNVRPSQRSFTPQPYSVLMPWGLKRFQEARCLHFITFSCYQRAPLLASPEARRVFEQTLERVRRWYGTYVAGYVVMPEHVHLLISEPDGGRLSVVIQMLKQNVAQQLRQNPRPVSPKNGETRTGHPFWYPILRFQCLESREAD
jgi:REP element-mobilizing transposase RayT